jgi:hypothetical protein
MVKSWVSQQEWDDLVQYVQGRKQFNRIFNVSYDAGTEEDSKRFQASIENQRIVSTLKKLAFQVAPHQVPS